MRALISERRIKTVVKHLARRIDHACGRRQITELAIICVMDGAFVFTADLVRAMRTPTRIVFAKASSYRETQKGATRVAGLPSSLRQKPVLIVDTIYDTGHTISRLVRQARRLTRTVWLAVLIEKQGKADFRLSDQAEIVFSGIQLSSDPFLVGYGLDVGGRFRCLPNVQQYRPNQVKVHAASRGKML